MKIGIDARLFGAADRGLGRYTQKLLKFLERTDRTNEYFVFLRKNGFAEYQPANKNFHKILADYRNYSFSEQLFFPFQLLFYRLDFVHFLHFNVPIFYPKKFIVTIHDLIISRYPDSRRKSTTLPFVFYQIKLFFYHLVLQLAVRRAKKIIAVSEFTKKEIEEILKIKSEKIEVIYEGIDPDQFPIPPRRDKFQTRKGPVGTIGSLYGIPDSYILYVGAAYPHKNLGRLLKAFKILINQLKVQANLKLVLVGKKDYFYQQIEKEIISLGLRERVVLTDEVSDEDLNYLYQQAIFLVFPSLCEGFGFPALEAMKNGLPVAASRASSLPEILDQAVVYFDPYQPKKIAETMKQLMSDEKLRENLRKLGRERVKRFSWHECAKKTLNVYKKNTKFRLR